MNNEELRFWYNEETRDFFAQQEGVEQPPNTIEVTYQEMQDVLYPPLPVEEIARRNVEVAKSVVRAEIRKPIEYNGNTYSMDDDFINHMLIRVLQEPENPQPFNFYDVNFEKVVVTYENLKSLLTSYRSRASTTLEAYNQWLQTDKLTPFEI